MATRTSTGVKRILKEAQEMETDDSCEYTAGPLEDDLFNWHFTIKGPSGSDFEGGVYHGRMILPSEYPFKPPEIYMATPSGRFETNKKICLSISSFHPETWQPSWGIRTALLALTAFFATEAAGAVGSLEVPPAERRRLAQASRTFHCPTCNFSAGKFLAATSTNHSSEAEDGETAEARDDDEDEEEAATAISSGIGRPDEATAIFPPSRGPAVGAAGVGAGAVPTPDHVSGTTNRVANTTAPHPRHHHLPTAAGTSDTMPAPQLHVVQHRPLPPIEPRAAVAGPSASTSSGDVAPPATAEGSASSPASTPAAPVIPLGPADAMMVGGQPTLIDRMILVVLVALLALIVRKIA